MASVQGGVSTSVPKWRSDGKEILFMSAGNAMMSAEVNGSGPAFQLGTLKQLFVAPPSTGWDVTADGTRFLMAVEPGQSLNTQTPITVVLDWQADLEKLRPNPDARGGHVDSPGCM
jgi:hypothetical protein